MMIALGRRVFGGIPGESHLLGSSKGHALTHQYHHGGDAPSGALRFIPAFSTGALAGAITAFMLGELVVSIADQLAGPQPAAEHAQS